MDLFLGSYWGKNGQEPDIAKTNTGGLFLFASFLYIPLTLRNCPGLSEW